MKFRCKGTGGKSHYSIQVQMKPRGRFVEVGQVWKEGSKWRSSADTDTWKHKETAAALVKGAAILELARRPDAEDDQAEHTRDMPSETDSWPSWAAWPKGTILKSLKYGDRGPLESAYTHRGSGRQRYAIWLKRSHVRLCGTAKQFEEVKDD